VNIPQYVGFLQLCEGETMVFPHMALCALATHPMNMGGGLVLGPSRFSGQRTAEGDNGAMVPCITVSIVSHGHGALVARLLVQLGAQCPAGVAVVVVTVNVPEPLHSAALAQAAHTAQHCGLAVEWVHNAMPQGFGANHNRAFALCESRYFCVMNPDIALQDDCNPFGCLQLALAHGNQDADDLASGAAGVVTAQGKGTANPAIAYPVQVDAQGKVLDYARALVTPWALVRRHVLRKRAVASQTMEPESVGPVHWASGAFLLFRADVFKALGGFDTRFFMYCEDVDLCLRAQLAGYGLVQADARVVHHTQRRTLKSLQHLAWHVRSLLRLWLSPVYRDFKRQFIKKIGG
jgi:N-acetylglucosaminyl-diphospho-decaprenol L-rhamnosyltransferase